MFESVFTTLGKGFGVSLELFGLTLLGALPLGLLIAFGSMSKLKSVAFLTRGFVWIVRGSPLMLQLFLIFYGPGLLFGWKVWGGSVTGRFFAALTAFVINYACYFSEIYRGGIEGIPQGQYEAGQVLGMTRSQIFFRVKLLQLIKRILPPISNEVITLVKDTSLARVILVYELMFAGERFVTGKGLIWPLFFTGVFYLAFTGILTILFRLAEKRLDYFTV